MTDDKESGMTTDDTDQSAAAAVERGMEWLDSRVPGWERKIDLATLEMSNGCNCVLGQTLQDVAVAAGMPLDGGSRADAYLWAAENYSFDPFDLGFILTHSEGSTWDELEEAWQTAIKRRFDTGVLSDCREAGATP